MALQGGQAVPEYVAQHPSSVWLVGPFFAAITGLAFKEVRDLGRFYASKITDCC